MESRKRQRYQMTCLWSLSLLVSMRATAQLELPRSIDGWIAQEAQINYLEHVQASKSDALARVVGGTEVAPGKYPFFVRIRGNIGASDCGGSLVAPDIVLTAGHCDTVGGEVFTVVVNGFTRSYDAEAGQVNRGVSQAIRHPDFNIDTFANDFMLLQLDEPVDIEPVVWNTDLSIPAVSDKVGVIGLGALSENGFNYPDTLREVWVDAIDVGECFNNYASEGLSIVRDDIMFCASTPGKDACQGDSGGPALSEDGVQIGVVSFGLGCARPGFPGVYAKVSSRTDWLNENICSLSAFCVDGTIIESQPDGKITDLQPDGDAASSAPAAVETATSAPVVAGTNTNAPAIVETATSAPVVAGTSTNAPAVVETATSVPVVAETDTNAPILSSTSAPIGSTSVSVEDTGPPVTLAPVEGTTEPEPTDLTMDESGASPAPVAGAVTEAPTFNPTQQPSMGLTATSVSAADTGPPVTLAPVEGTIQPEPTDLTMNEPGASPAPVSGAVTEAPTFNPTQQPSMGSTTGQEPTDLAAEGPGASSVPVAGVNYDGARGPGICDDFLDQTFVINLGYLDRKTRGAGRGVRDCVWLQAQTPEMIIKYCDPDGVAYDVCEETCGKCVDDCKDVDNAAFLVQVMENAEPEVHGCAWLQERPNMRAMLCVPDNDAYSVCPETCNSCSAEADSVPNRASSDMMLATLESRGRFGGGDIDKQMQEILRVNDDFTRQQGST